MKTSNTAVAKLERKIDLATAQLAAAEGRHAEACALFAKHGISYHHTVRN